MVAAGAWSGRVVAVVIVLPKVLPSFVRGSGLQILGGGGEAKGWGTVCGVLTCAWRLALPLARGLGPVVCGGGGGGGVWAGGRCECGWKEGPLSLRRRSDGRRELLYPMISSALGGAVRCGLRMQTTPHAPSHPHIRSTRVLLHHKLGSQNGGKSKTRAYQYTRRAFVHSHECRGMARIAWANASTRVFFFPFVDFSCGCWLLAFCLRWDRICSAILFVLRRSRLLAAAAL